MMRIIDYDKSMHIVNTEQLPHGTGAKYLEVIKSHIEGEYIAVQWRNKPIVSYQDHVLIAF
jgi:hypothetical protein